MVKFLFSLISHLSNEFTLHRSGLVTQVPLDQRLFFRVLTVYVMYSISLYNCFTLLYITRVFFSYHEVLYFCNFQYYFSSNLIEFNPSDCSILLPIEYRESENSGGIHWMY